MDWRAIRPVMPASDDYLVVNVAIRSNLSPLVHNNAHPVVMKTGSRPDRNLWRQNTAEKEIENSLDQPGDEWYLMKVTPTRNGVKS
jgi:hypothetical protein